MSDAFEAFQPDPRFFETSSPLSLSDAARLADATIVQCENDKGRISHVAPLGRCGEGAVVFVETKKALEDLAPEAAPSLVLVKESVAALVEERWPHAAIATCASPKAGFAAIGRALHHSRSAQVPGSARIDETASIASSAQIAPTAVIMANAQIGDHVVVGSFCVIGPGVVIGAGTKVLSHVTISHAVIGRECVISSGVRIGESGFGYVPSAHGAAPIPQLGRVLMGDHVDLGANSTVDRGALEDTVIGDGTKIDNLVQIAHNCRLGRHVLVASQTGVSGSCVVGDGVMIGGQAGMADHLTIGAGAVITAKSGLMKDIPAGEKWGGIPAKPAREWMKEVATVARLAKKGTK